MLGGGGGVPAPLTVQQTVNHEAEKWGREWLCSEPQAAIEWPDCRRTNDEAHLTTDDLMELAASLGTCPYDGDFNGLIDIDDLLGVIAAYGGGCQ